MTKPQKIRRAPAPSPDLQSFIDGATATKADRAPRPKPVRVPTVKRSFDIPEQLHRDVKLEATRQGITMRQIVLSAFEDFLEAARAEEEGKP